MSIIKNISLALRWYKEMNKLSMNELALRLGVAPSSLQGYMAGTANPRADTIELLSERTHIPLTQMVSGPVPGLDQAETIYHAARVLSDLPEEKQEEGIRLLIQMASLFAKDP